MLSRPVKGSRAWSLHRNPYSKSSYPDFRAAAQALIKNIHREGGGCKTEGDRPEELSVSPFIRVYLYYTGLQGVIQAE